jgi:hypothetical protein
MKKTAVLAGISFLGLLIVLPVTCFVNHSACNPIFNNHALQADGAPMPAPIPHTKISIIADGAPMPAPIPHPTIKNAISSSFLIADGAPMPAPIPHGDGPHVTVA